MKKKYFKSTTIFVILAVIAIIAFFYIKGDIAEKIEEHRQESEALYMNWDEKFAEAESVLAQEVSDIEGWSNLDKKKAGLNPVDGSDTDGDGLTDKEEIEIYGSDPKLKSTAGDFYEDGYKVENGMDLFMKYDYSEEIVFEHNECAEIIFTADNILDLWASASDVTGLYKERRTLTGNGYAWVEKYNTYKEYCVYNYGGTLSIDVSDILKENGIGLTDIVVLLCKDTVSDEIETCKFTSNGNVLTLDTQLEQDSTYILAIANKKTNNTFFNNFFGNTEDEVADNKGDFLYSFITAAFLFGHEPEILYVSSGDDIEDQKMLDAAIKSARKAVDDGTFHQDYKITLDDCVEVTQEELDKKRNWLRRIFPNCEFSPYETEGKSTLQLLLLEYYDYSSVEFMVKEGAAITPFYTQDILPFGNFCTQIAPGGNCAGIAHLTSSVYNTGSVPLTGSYGDITWDMTLDENGETFSDRYLFDYKDTGFLTAHKSDNGLIEKNLTVGEQQFVNMVGAYLWEGNDRVNMRKYLKSIGESNYSFGLIKDMIAYLDSGRILDVYLTFQNKDGEIIGHTVNVFDYNYSVSSLDEIYFYCYDTNYAFKKDKLNVTNVITVYRKRDSEYGYTDTFDYYYCPGGNSWKATNFEDVNKTGDYVFVVLDHEWNIFNDKYLGSYVGGY